MRPKLLTLYRGTQRPDLAGVRKGLSFADSLDVAAIWSAVPGSPPRFLDSSTIHVVQVRTRKPLVLRDNNMNFADLLDVLGFDSPRSRPRGISVDEAIKVLAYLCNRESGQVPGGSFEYRIELDESLLRSPLQLLKRDFKRHQSLEVASELTADTFAFIDAPAVQRAATALGYDLIVYDDVFAGGSHAAEELLGRSVRDLAGVRMQMDVDEKYVPTHRTYRTISSSGVTVVGQMDPRERIAR